jgi:hypothetical protein
MFVSLTEPSSAFALPAPDTGNKFMLGHDAVPTNYFTYLGW